MSDGRARSWTYVAYPGDSLPEDYVQLMNGQLLRWAESPVHDADLNGDGAEKKRHIHIVVSWPTKKSFDQACEISEMLHCPRPQPVRDMRTMLRYMIHLDNPEKAQYKEQDIKTYGGFSTEDYFKRSNADSRIIVKEILQFCLDNEISEFSDLVDLAYQMDNDEWIDILTCRNTLFFSTYLKSKHYSKQESQL